METGFLDRLANQLKVNKSATCRRAIQRILHRMKEHCERGQYQTTTEAGTIVGTSPAQISSCARSGSLHAQEITWNCAASCGLSVPAASGPVWNKGLAERVGF